MSAGDGAYETFSKQGGQQSVIPKATPVAPVAGGAVAGRAVNQVRVEWRNPCEDGLQTGATGAAICPANPCAAGEVVYRAWEVGPGYEQRGDLVCTGADQAVAAAAPPQITDAMVLAAFRRIPVPQIRSLTQPGDKTLVNFDTIFHAEAEPFTETVTLLGQQVRLDITPTSYHWDHGDGTTSTTTTPGAPYPSKDITHRYIDAHTTVHHRVTVTWSATWSLDGGPTNPVNGTVTTPGPTTALRIAEAVPALSGRR